MIDLQAVEISEDLRNRLLEQEQAVRSLRSGEALDPASLAKLQEHFRAMHIYHSAGIEGNRLTLQETLLVLQEGIDISGKPLKDTLEVKDLGAGFDFLCTLAGAGTPLRESDIRDLHKLVVGSDGEKNPGDYRRVPVVIVGSDHTPPEAINVPMLMPPLVDWINANIGGPPVILGALAHHELASIHPFVDGNGRVSRLLLNLLLIRSGFPVCNIRREDRPKYYEALAYADIGLFEPLVEIVGDRVQDLLKEYQRLEQETKRTREWAAKWKTKELGVLRRREQREYEIWLAKMRQVRLEFEKAADLISDNLQEIAVDFYDFKREIDFDTYQLLRDTGRMEHANAFSISLFHKPSKRRERFMFRYFRNWKKFTSTEDVVPLELNYLKGTEYVRLADLPEFGKVKLRELYFDDGGQVVNIQYDPTAKLERRHTEHSIEQIVRLFINDLLEQVMGLT